MTRQTLLSWLVPVLVLSMLAGGLVLLFGQQEIARADELVDSQPLQAYQIYVDWMRWMPWQADLPEKAGVAALLGGEAGQALALLQESQALTASGRLALAEAHFQLGEYDRAEVILLGLYENDQKNLFLLERLATLKHWQGDFTSERAFLEEGLAQDPKNPRLLFARALLIAADRPGQAIPELQALLAIDPAEDTEALLAALERGTKTTSLSQQRLAAGQALASMNEWLLAAQAFEHSLELNPNLGESRAWLAEARQQTGRAGEALPLLERAVRDSPQSPRVFALLGLYWQRQGDMERSVEAYRSAVLLDPNNPVWRMSLAQSYETAGNLTLALAYYESAAQLDATNAELWRALAVFCLQNDVYLNEVALLAAFRAHRLEPENPDSLDVLGRVLALVGSPKSAIRYLLQAIELAPEVAAYHFHLGLVFLQEGQPELAYGYLQNTVRLDPQGPFGDQARRVLERYNP